MDELASAGYDVYALDFLGYGESDRYPKWIPEYPKARRLAMWHPWSHKSNPP
jgi:pimeloyl-ACP methyl ester carboxylesterase